jgi:hypothetical protein
MKTILVFLAPWALEIPKLFFENPPTVGFQKTIFYNRNCCPYLTLLDKITHIHVGS